VSYQHLANLVAFARLYTTIGPRRMQGTRKMAVRTSFLLYILDEVFV